MRTYQVVSKKLVTVKFGHLSLFQKRQLKHFDAARDWNIRLLRRASHQDTRANQ